MKGVKRTRKNDEEEAARPAKGPGRPRPLPVRLGEVAPGALDEFLDREMAVCLWQCSRTLRRDFSPAAAPVLWRRIRPSVAQTIAAARTLTPASAAVLFRLHDPAQRHVLEHGVRQAACATGNLALIRWILERTVYYGWESFETACEHGHIAVAKAIAPDHVGTFSTLAIANVIKICCQTEELAMADWVLVRYGHASKEPATSYLDAACRADSADAARWVLSRFPLDYAIGELLLTLAHKHEGAAVIRWALETLPVGEEYLREHAWSIANMLENVHASTHRRTRDWFVEQYKDLLAGEEARESARLDQEYRQLLAFIAAGPAAPPPPPPAPLAAPLLP